GDVNWYGLFCGVFIVLFSHIFIQPSINTIANFEVRSGNGNYCTFRTLFNHYRYATDLFSVNDYRF
ncbi:hypothetical protein ACKE2E_16025, partial [Yersinia enterocolitica]